MSKLTITLMMMILSISLMACSGASAATLAENKADGPAIKVMEPYARAAMPNGAVFMQLINEGNADDRLISAQSDVAEAVELHETKMENDMMKMGPIEAVAVSAGESAVLKPGGMHVMLMGLKQELAIGDTFEVTLNFENSAPQTITVEVTEGMGAAMNHDHDMGSGDMNPMDHGQDMAQMDHDHNKIPNNGAIITIVSPAAGTEFAAGEMITVKVGTEGFNLNATDNHWHLYVDGKLVEMVQTGQNETMLHGLEPGTHTVMTTLADADHNEYEDGAMTTITVH